MEQGLEEKDQEQEEGEVIAKLNFLEMVISHNRR